MVKLPNIIPITDLRQGAAGVIRRVKDSREPVFITQRGRATAVLMSAEVYERSENEREILKLLARGEKEIEAGTGNELSVVMAKAEALLQDKRS
jgi:prevent-host-death family protein